MMIFKQSENEMMKNTSLKALRKSYKNVSKCLSKVSQSIKSIPENECICPSLDLNAKIIQRGFSCSCLFSNLTNADGKEPTN